MRQQKAEFILSVIALLLCAAAFLYLAISLWLFNAAPMVVSIPEEKLPYSVVEADRMVFYCSAELLVENVGSGFHPRPRTEDSVMDGGVPEASHPTNAPEPAPWYSDEELEWMAIVIFNEAGGDAASDETRIMVGNVVLNRVADERFPDTIYEVLTQERQYGLFHWIGIQWADRAADPLEAHAVERAYECARRVLDGERALPPEVVWQSENRQGTVLIAQDGIFFGY